MADIKKLALYFRAGLPTAALIGLRAFYLVDLEQLPLREILPKE